MGRLNKTGVRGLIRELVTDKAGATTERWSIDLRYRDPATGAWQRYRERLPDGVRAAAAKTRARKVNNSAAAGTLEAQQHEPKTLGAALDEYLKSAEANTPGSVPSKRTQAKALKAGLGASTELDRLSAFAVEKFKRDRIAGTLAIPTKKGPKANKVSPASVNRAMALLKHACRLWMAWGWMKPATAASIRGVKLLKESAGRTRELSADEEARIMAALAPGVKRILEAATLTGMRRANVVRLRRDQVNLVTREITLTKTKNGKPLEVPINDRLADLLTAAMAGPKSEYVFLSQRGAPYSVDTISRAFARAAKKAKVDGVRFHDARHTFAGRLRRQGVQLDVLQDLGGWSSLQMVRRYSKIGRKEKHDAVAMLNRIAQDSPTAQEANGEKANRMEAMDGYSRPTVNHRATGSSPVVGATGITSTSPESLSKQSKS